MEKEIWVECIDNTNGALEFLTIGKQYLATIKDEFTYIVKNNKGINDWFSKQRFKPVNKTSILRIVQTNLKDNLKEIVGNSVINVSFFNEISTCDKIEILIEDNTSGIVTDVYTLSTIFNDKLLNKANLILKEYGIKLELEQQPPKFKINCDKLYTKEEAEKLKESGIDLVEVSE